MIKVEFRQALMAAGCLALLVTALVGQSGLDVRHYDIAVDVLDENLEQTATLHVIGADRPKRWRLSLFGAAVNVRSAKAGDRDVPFERVRGAVELDLSGVPAGESGEFAITLEVYGRPYNKQRGRGYVRTTVSPEHTYIRGQYAWYPRVANDVATYRVEVTARKGWRVRTAGTESPPKVDGDSATWTFTKATPTWQIGLVAGPYEHLQLSAAGGFVLDALFFEKHEGSAKKLLGIAKQAYENYGRRYGKVETKRFTLVEMPAAFGEGSGYSEPGYVLVGSGAFARGGTAPWAASLVAHEVSHTWWGESVRFKNFASESLACYATLCYLTEHHGADAAREERRRAVERVVKAADRGKEIAFDDIHSWGSGMDRETYRSHAYEKGMMMLSMIADAAGEKALDRALAKFLKEHRGKRVDYATLRGALVKHCPKSKPILATFEKPGIPRLSLDHATKKAGRRCKLTGTLACQGTPTPFRCSVAIAAKCGDKEVRSRVKLTGKKKKFTITLPSEPECVIVDPDYRLLAGRPPVGPVDPDAVMNAAFKVVNSPKAGNAAVLRRTIAQLELVLAGDPGKHEPTCYTGIGRCRFRLGEFDAAIAAFEESLTLGSGGPFHRAWVYLRLGCIADVRGRRKRAIEHYRKAVSQGSRYVAAQRAQEYLKRRYRGYKVER